MATQSAPKRAVQSPLIPDRLYFKIGDVARICEVEPYVLRFWETQFPQLKPNKSGTGQRLYRRRDVELALQIKQLVHDQGYTLSGARQALGAAQRGSTPLIAAQSQREQPESAASGRQDSVAAAIGRARVELREIADLLASPLPRAPRRRSQPNVIAETSGLLFPS